MIRIVVAALFLFFRLNFASEEDRTAVIITGQIRGLNFSWNSGLLDVDVVGSPDAYFQPLYVQHMKLNSSERPRDTIVERLFKPLMRTGFDVFMHGTSTETPVDNSICTILMDPDIFNAVTGNRFFCLIERERTLNNIFLLNSPFWNGFTFGKELGEALLQQIFSLYRANQAAKTCSARNGVVYKYKIRLRADSAFFLDFPDITSIDFGPLPPNFRERSFPEVEGICDTSLRHASLRYHGGGHVDWFAVGKSADMDVYLDRYTSLLYDSTVKESVEIISQSDYWYYEQFTLGVLLQNEICIGPDPDIAIGIVRLKGHKSAVVSPAYNDDDEQWAEFG
jgi:hypothetical protein